MKAKRAIAKEFDKWMEAKGKKWLRDRMVHLIKSSSGQLLTEDKLIDKLFEDFVREALDEMIGEGILKITGYTASGDRILSERVGHKGLKERGK